MNFSQKLELLSRDGLVRKYPAGSTILYQGEAPRSAYIVNSGFAKAFNISSDGSEQIVNFYVPGEVFPIGWLWGKINISVYFIEAMTDCSMLLVPREKIKSRIENSPHLLKNMVDYTVANYTAAIMHICALEQAKASQKILYTLYYLSSRFGKVNSKKLTDITLQLTHQDIASLVGLTRETTATELNKLKKSGILSYRNKQYRINAQKLLDAMGEDSFEAIKF